MPSDVCGLEGECGVVCVQEGLHFVKCGQPVDDNRRGRQLGDGKHCMEMVETGMIPREESAWHAGDVRGPARNLCSLRVVLITRSCTGFTMLNPAYQNPDRRGRAEVTRGYRDDRG